MEDSLPLEEIIQLSHPVDTHFDCIIYFLIDTDKVVYVGKSKRGLSRIYGHLGKKRFNRFYYIGVTAESMNKLEAHYIKKFTPIYNIQGNDIPNPEDFEN